MRNQSRKDTLKRLRRLGLAFLAATLAATLILTWKNQETELDHPIIGVTGPCI